MTLCCSMDDYVMEVMVDKKEEQEYYYLINDLVANFLMMEN